MATASYVRKWLEINGIPKEVEKIVGYCIRKENGKVFDDWGEDIITTMVTYHMMKKTISVIKDGDEVVGVHMWYNCNYDDGWDFIKNWEEDKPNGDTVFLAFLFADNKEAMSTATGATLTNEVRIVYDDTLETGHLVTLINRIRDKILEVEE